ncbi:5406_t:CDS:1 [Funneliformis mosseae]|uniref:5406_t:CDS:1 n=1 Tax=Funneliformis mosseae TaxID=27381 RepID=A0A9N9CWG6_FUNMO|nr:5406_t:CDS:1 [Funneliformis mosseae]
MSNIESSRPSIEEAPLTPMTEIPYDSIAPSTTRDSIITYSTDLGDSSMTTDYVYENKEKEVSSGTPNPPAFYRRKRFWALCAAISTIIAAIFIPLLFLVIVPNVAQSTVNKSQIKFLVINITQATNDGFLVEMSGVASNAGIFDATLTFNGPLSVIYKDNKIGTVKLDDLKVSGGKGDVSGINSFTIVDKQAFEQFTGDAMVDEFFEWTLQGSANVRALGVTTKNLNVNKVVKIPGGNGFKSKLTNLKVSQNQDNSFSMEMTTILNNSSPLCMELGNLTLQVLAGDTVLLNVTSNYFYLVPNENTLILSGIAQMPTSDVEKLMFLSVIEAYLSNKPINATAKGVSTSLNGGPVDWLEAAVASLTLHTEVGGADKPPQLITSVDLGQMSMQFTPETAFSPLISAKNTTANFVPPFAIPFQILSIQQELNINYNGKPAATVQTPDTPVTTANGEISLDVPETHLQASDGFSDLLTALTTTDGSDVEITGKANITAKTPLGQTIIHEIPFNVTSRMEGLNEFNSPGGAPVVNNISVLSGSPKQIILGSVVTLINPTLFSASIGQVDFNLYSNNSQIGTVTINDLSVVPGPNPLAVLITLDDPANNAGNDVLISYLSGKDTVLNIKGFETSTKVASLVPAFKAIDIPTPLPPFNLPLVTKVNIEVTAESARNNTLITIIEMTNPFAAPLTVYTMDSDFSVNGTTLGSISLDLKDQPIFVPGNAISKLGFNVKMLLDPTSLISLMRNLAIAKGMDVTVLDFYIGLLHLNIPGANANAIPTPGADITTFIKTALKEIPTHVNLKAQAAIGEYFLPSFEYQQDVTAETDDTILLLLISFIFPQSK